MADSILQEDASYILHEDGVSKISLETPVTNYLQQENGDYILQEDGSKILLDRPIVYRKSQVINSQAGAGTGYQKLFKVYRGSGTDGNETVGGTTARKIYLNCAPDFSNIQFRGSDETTVLSHWLQEKVDGSYALFWVKIPDDLSVANATIYIYYGAVSSNSNIHDTFIKADNFDSFVKYPNNPVMTGNSAWEGGVLCEPTVMLEDGVFKMWYRGGHPNSAIGYATSSDGITWDKHPANPIITAPGGVAFPTVIKIDSTYYMYASKLTTGNLFRWSSSDGISWNIDNGGAAILDIPEIVANVSIYYDPTDTPKWRMLYEVLESTFYLRYAHCEDGLSWASDTTNHVFPQPAGNPSEVIKLDDVYYCWTGEITSHDWKISLIKSTDWRTWTRVGIELVESQPSDGTVITDPCLLLDVSGQAHKCYMWYIGNQDTLEMAYLDIDIADYVNTLKRSPTWSMDNMVAGKADNKLKAVHVSANPASYYFNGIAPPHRILAKVEQRDNVNWFGLHHRTNLAADNTSYYAMQQGSGRTLEKLAGSETNTPAIMSLNTPYVLEVTDDATNVNYYFNLAHQRTKTSTTNNTKSGVGIQVASSMGSVDWIALAKLTNPEPSFGSTGSQEEVSD